MPRKYFHILGTLLFLPLSSQAAPDVPAVTCHCFTDRAYDPSRPALADPYFLATTQNSFFAAFFNVDKKMIVMKKQAGCSADDLWVAYWVSSRSGVSGETLLALRGKKESWKEVVVPLKLSAKSLGERFAAEVAGGEGAARLAKIIVDDILVRNRLLGTQELATLRKEWASNQEVIMTALISVRIKRPATQIYHDVKRRSKSWGAFLGEAKIQPGEIQSEFVTLLKASYR